MKRNCPSCGEKLQKLIEIKKKIIYYCYKCGKQYFWEKGKNEFQQN